MIFYAVFLISASALAFEVLLTRVFSINQWNHLSFMVISIALFGFAVSGTWLSILRTGRFGRRWDWPSGGFIRLLLWGYTAGVLAAYLALNTLPMDYFRLPLEPVQSLYLLAAYLMLAAPFFAAGLTISIAYTAYPEKAGITYFANMSGSAVGAALPYLLLPLLEEGRLVLLTAVLPLPAMAIPPGGGAANRSYYRSLAGALLVMVAAGLLLWQPALKHFLAVKPSAYKSLSQTLRLPDSRITESHSGIRGRIDMVSSPFIRHAPGLSLTYGGDLPAQFAGFRDGDNRLAFYDYRDEKGLDFARFLIATAGYRMVPDPRRVLIALNGGGSSIACALAAGAQRITILESNPYLAREIRRHYRLPVVTHPARSFLPRHPGRFDIIQIDNRGPSMPGAAALNQEYAFTRQTFRLYLQHLSPDGVLIIERCFLLPPADALRLWATAYESLKSIGIDVPGRHMAVLRNYDTVLLLVGRRPLPSTPQWLPWIQERNFDLVYSHDIRSEWANRFFVSDSPAHYREIQRLQQAYATGTQQRFFEHYPLDIRPQSDDRPFPGRVIKWHRLVDFYQSMGRQIYALMLSSEFIVGVVLLEALLLTLIILVLPVGVFYKAARKPSIFQAGYFLALGAGFMLMELYFINELVIVFDDPIISLTVVLSAILIFSAGGGYVSQRLHGQPPALFLLLLILVLAALILILDPVLAVVVGWSRPLQVTAVLALLLPAGFLAGFPFPLGMRRLLVDPVQRAYAWAANGCTSVLASIVAAQTALSWGIDRILWAAALAYGIALVMALKIRR
jgi:hypothetical protein